MIMRPAAFNALPTALLLISVLSLQSLGDQERVTVWAKLDPGSPEYKACQQNQCASYLNITSVCDGKKTDGNFTWDPEVAKQNYLRCTCSSPQYLPARQK